MAKPAARFWKVREIVTLFIDMGCDHNVAEESVDDGDGNTFGLSYLVNPETMQAVPILDLNADDQISEFEVDVWERRLGVKIPRPPPI